jgi:hypothetical protein
MTQNLPPHLRVGTRRQVIDHKPIPAQGMEIMSIKSLLPGALALALSVGLLPTAVLALNPTTVNCPDSIQVAIDGGFDEITVNGTCTENVFVRHDDITIQGDGNDTIVGQLWVEGARRIAIQNLTITGGPENGIMAINGATVTAANLLIENVPHVGVNTLRNASVVADNVTIRNANYGVSVGDSGNLNVTGSLIEQIALNGVDVFNGGTAALNQVTIRGAATGIFAGANAYVEVTGAVIENSGDAGISLHRGADSLLTSSTIQNNGGNGIVLDTNCSAIGGDLTIVGNGGVGMVVAQESTAVLDNLIVRDNAITGIDVSKGSSGTFTNSTIENNGECGVCASHGSSVDLGDNTIAGSLEGVSISTHSFGFLAGNDISSTAEEDSAALGVLWGSTGRLNGQNTLASNGWAAYSQQGSTLLQHHRGHDTLAGRIQVTADSNAEFRNVAITGPVEISDHSVVRISDRSGIPGNVSLKGEVSVSRDSGLNFLKGTIGQRVRVVGNIKCADAESSLGASSSTANITGKVNCTGY